MGLIPVGQNSYETLDAYNAQQKSAAEASGQGGVAYNQATEVNGTIQLTKEFTTAVQGQGQAVASTTTSTTASTAATQANTTAQQLQTAATTATANATTNQTVSTNDLGTATAGAVTSQTQLAVATQGGSVALTDSLIPSLNAAGVATAGLTSTQLANTDALTLQAQAMGVVTESGSFYETELQSLGVTMQTNSDGTETWGGNLANVQTAQDDLNSALANAINEMRTANSAQTDLASSIGDTGDASGTSATSVGDLTSQVTDVGNAASGAAQAMDQLGASLANLGGGTSIGGSGAAPTGSGPQPAGTFNAATYVGLLPYGQLTTQEQGQLGSDTSQGQIVNFWDQMGTVTPVIEGFTEALGKIQPVIDGLTLNQGGVTGTIPGNSPQEILQSAAGLGSGIYNEVLAILEAQGYVPQVSGAVQGPPITNATPNSPSPLPTVNTATYVPGGIQDSATTTTAQPVAGGGAATVNVTLPGAQITSMSTAQTFLAQMAYQMRSIVKF
jgi:hypothetical protein